MAGELEKITVKGTEASKEPDFPAYVIGPKGAPGLVMLQEWWGIDFEIKKQAKIAADHGFRVLVPDLYRGKLGTDVEEAHHLMDNLDWSNSVEDITACARHLLQEGSPKVGAVGFCMGGALSGVAAIRVPEVSAAVAFYGTPNPQLADATTCKKPVQAHFGEKDSMKGFSSPEDAKAFAEKLEKAGCTYELHMYPGQGHAFMNQSPEAIERKKAMGLPEHDQKTVDLAWSRTFAWFDKYVKESQQ